MLEEDKFSNTVINVRDDISSKNIKSYQRKREYSFGSKLSSIREEMREFCDSMDRFVDENKIMFKNGEVEGFWGERKMVDENLQTDFVDDSKIQETGTKVSASEEDKLRWWSTKERKLKVKEILKKREDEAKKNEVEKEDIEINDKSDHEVEKEDIEINDKSDHCSSEDKKQPADVTNNFQAVYDLMTQKTCTSSVLPDSVKTYSTKDTEKCEQSEKIQQCTSIEQEESCEVFNSLFTELRNRDCVQKMYKPKVSIDLIDLEEKLDCEKSAIDTEKRSVCTFINMKDLDANEQSSKCENIVEEDNSVKIEILEDKVNNLSLESSEGKKNVDESDDDSFKTATSVQEDSQIAESNFESSEVLRLTNMENNFDKIVDSIKNENIDHLTNNYWKKIVSNKEHNDALGKDEKINDKPSDKMVISKREQEFSTETAQSNSQMESLVRTINRLSLERASHSSRLTGKRAREAEDIEVSNKKSFLIEEINPGRKPEERKSRSQISERCRQHLIQETKKFARKVSPLIDKCITNLIKDAENAGEKSQRYKYDRRSLGEYVPFNYISKMDLSKPAGDFGERDNCHNKNGNKSSDVTSTYSERQQLMTEQTINLQSAASGNHSGKVNVLKYKKYII